MHTVELHEITHRYRSTTALSSVSLALRPGVTGLLGPNGAGKSTLLRVVATVQEPTSGSVRLLGSDALDDVSRTRIRRRLGYLPQELGFPRGFTAFGFVDYMAVLKEWVDPSRRRAEVRRVLDLVDLSSVTTKRVSRLSGGMRRRLGLAQALIGDPALLVLDEPTSGLDPEQRAAFRALVLELGSRSTILISTHQTDDVDALCERVAVLDTGRVACDGSVRDFVASAEGQVWLTSAPDPAAAAHRGSASGRYRNVGTPPPGAELAPPDVEDAYLFHRHRASAGAPR